MTLDPNELVARVTRWALAATIPLLLVLAIYSLSPAKPRPQSFLRAVDRLVQLAKSCPHRLDLAAGMQHLARDGYRLRSSWSVRLGLQGPSPLSLLGGQPAGCRLCAVHLKVVDVHGPSGHG